ncbi:MAG: hypothetical protein ACK4VM_19970, partial [Bosea sp. (in: a-proteobacteria)]
MPIRQSGLAGSADPIAIARLLAMRVVRQRSGQACSPQPIDRYQRQAEDVCDRSAGHDRAGRGIGRPSRHWRNGLNWRSDLPGREDQHVPANGPSQRIADDES